MKDVSSLYLRVAYYFCPLVIWLNLTKPNVTETLCGIKRQQVKQGHDLKFQTQKTNK